MEVPLRKRIGREEFDYPALMAALGGLASPHAKITSLIEKGEIVRVKKGLYVFGADHRQRPYSRELLANLAYGPSFISLDYALSKHGLIPERVEALTSVTSGRARTFQTPIGAFVYRHTPVQSFHLGMNRYEGEGGSFLMASPERALVDKVRDDRSASVRSIAYAGRYLVEDLRIDQSVAHNLDFDSLAQIAEAMGSRKAMLCAKFLLQTRTTP